MMTDKIINILGCNVRRFFCFKVYEEPRNRKNVQKVLLGTEVGEGKRP